MAGIHVKFDINPEDFLADLTDAAYQVALRYKQNSPFIDLELELHKTLREVMKREMWESPVCGTTPCCLAAEKYPLWVESV